MRKTNVEKLADWFMNNTDVKNMNSNEIEDFLLEIGSEKWNDIIYRLNIKSIKPQSVIDMTPKFVDIMDWVIIEIVQKSITLKFKNYGKIKQKTVQTTPTM